VTTVAKLRITIDIFSGRPNPVIELSAKESREALAMLERTRRLEKGEPGMPPEPTLGYRGLIVEQVGAVTRGVPRSLRVANDTILGGRVPLAADDDAFEQFVLSEPRLRKLGLGRDLPRFVKREVSRFKRIRALWPWPHVKAKRPIVRLRCRCAPLYEPAWWNDGGQRQLRNNCYNYASNYRTDTFHQIPGGSQPGAAAGAMYTSLTGPSVRAAAIADDLIDSPGANNVCPSEGHLVALVIAPGIDFHWYRKGRSGRWTHKPGSTPATDLDNSSHVITDPRTADRGMYTQFTTFMTVMHGHIKIK
jgi:hypothetical protein